MDLQFHDQQSSPQKVGELSLLHIEFIRQFFPKATTEGVSLGVNCTFWV